MRPCAQAYNTQYERFPCTNTSATDDNPILEGYMSDERYMSFAQFLQKFQTKRDAMKPEDREKVKRQKLSYDLKNCLHFECEYWKLRKAIENGNSQDFEHLKNKILKTFFPDGVVNTLGIDTFNDDENQPVDHAKLAQELKDLQLTDANGVALTPEKLKTDFEIGRFSTQSNANMCDIYLYEYYVQTKTLDICCCYCK